MFGGIYYGAMYGGSTTSILLNTPGETASIATASTVQMARQGRGAAALTTAAVGSFVAGTLATLALTFCAPPLASVALRFGPAEYFGLGMLAFTMVTALVGGVAGPRAVEPLPRARPWSHRDRSPDGRGPFFLRHPATARWHRRAHPRHRPVRRGRDDLQAWQFGRDEPEVVALHDFTGMNRDEWARSWRPWLRGAAIGFPLGVLPCGGSVIPTFLSYTVEKRFSPHPEQFGHGAIEGVAGPEAANNAAAAGVLVPLLTLGCRRRRRRPCCWRRFSSMACSPDRSSSPRVPSRVDAHRQPVCRQRHAAGAEPAARARVGAGDAGAALAPVRRHPGAGLAWRLQPQPVDARFAPLYGSAESPAPCASTTCLWCRRCSASSWVRSEQQFRRAMAISEGNVSVFLTRPISATLLVLAILALTGPLLLSRLAPSPAKEAG